MTTTKVQLIAIFVVLWAARLTAGNDRIYLAQYVATEDGSAQIVYEGWVPGNPDKIRGIDESVYPRFIREGSAPSGGQIVELRSRDSAAVQLELRHRNVKARADEDSSREDKDEVFTLAQNGPPSNRIDLVFMGDGYTRAEKEKFLDDMKRLAREMFEQQTFKSQLALFNIHAVFRASQESGIGKNDKPKNTAYGLYREGDTLRAIMMSKPQAASDSCRQAPGCDYAIIVGNDPYYGGLGGQFAITTSSVRSGTVVLRHELGHTLGDLGDEYDGAEGSYFGANHASSLSSVEWKHWLTGPLEAEKAIAHYIGWPWKNLADGPFSVSFNSTGLWATGESQFSVSGIETDRDLEITFDGKQVPFASPGHSDRVFQTQTWEKGFSAGPHELKFAQGVNDGNNVFSSLTLHEYGPGYHLELGYIGAFPLFTSALQERGYRPTHGTCLMRNMDSQVFCPVCQENNWLQLLRRVSVIDEVKVSSTEGKGTAIVYTPPFEATSGSLRVSWFHNGKEVPELGGQKSWELSLAESLGQWEVEVTLVTPEVRRDPDGLLKARKKFSL